MSTLYPQHPYHIKWSVAVPKRQRFQFNSKSTNSQPESHPGQVVLHELPKITKKPTKITTKHTKIKSTSCRYTLTGFKNVTFITVSNILMISSKNMWKYTKEPEFFSFSFLNPVKIYLQNEPVISVHLAVILVSFLVIFRNFQWFW